MFANILDRDVLKHYEYRLQKRFLGQSRDIVVERRTPESRDPGLLHAY